MATTARAGASSHLWIVGILALLWNGYGCYQYVMTMTGNEAFLSSIPADTLAYWETLPSWSAATWAFGVWGGLAGAILLLMRSRYAVWAFALSLVGAVVGFGYEIFMTERPASMTQGMMAIMPWVVILIAAFQLWYSWDQEKKRVLR